MADQASPQEASPSLIIKEEQLYNVRLQEFVTQRIDP
jgi:hypothetical protein